MLPACRGLMIALGCSGVRAAAPRHRVPRVHGEVEERQFELVRVHLAWGQALDGRHRDGGRQPV